MRNLVLPILLAGSAALAGCATVPPATVAGTGVCGTYGYVDVNNDGWISGDEWNTYRTSTYSFWDVDRDGRISRSEFENCYRAGGFYRDAYYKPDYWTNYWTTFDANGDGYLSNDEYWSAQSWTRIDSDEWVWWNM